MNEKVTIEWLHSIKPAGWKAETRGISYENWCIHSIKTKPVLERDDWAGYDAGPFIWTVQPTHGQNMLPLEKQERMFTILVMETRDDVTALLRLLVRGYGHQQLSVEQLTENFYEMKMRYSRLAAAHHRATARLNEVQCYCPVFVQDEIRALLRELSAKVSGETA